MRDGGRGWWFALLFLLLSTAASSKVSESGELDAPATTARFSACDVLLARWGSIGPTSVDGPHVLPLRHCLCCTQVADLGRKAGHMGGHDVNKATLSGRDSVALPLSLPLAGILSPTLA